MIELTNNIISESESAFFKSLFENNTVAMLLIRPNTGEIVLANKAAQLFYGWNLDEMCAMNVFEINTLPENEVRNAMQAAKNNDKNIFEFKHLTANGTIKNVAVFSGLVQYNNEALLYSSVVDQTDVENARQKTKEIMEFYRAITEFSKEGVVVVSAENKFMFISDNSKRNFGYDIDDESIYSLQPRECTHPEDVDRVENEVIKTIMNVNYSPTLRYRFKTKNNDWIWIESTFTNMLGNPNVGGIVINFKDISNRILLENQININEKFSDFLLETSALFIDMPIGMYEKQINEILKKMCDFALADRAYIYTYDNTTKLASNTFEYATNGIEAKINDRQQIAFESFGLIYQHHSKAQSFVCNTTEQLAASSTKDMLIGMNIKSILAVPMMFENTCVGCIGFDWVRTETEINEKTVSLLGHFAQQIVNLNNRIELEKKVSLINERYRLTQEAGNVGGWEYNIKTAKYWQTNQFLKIFGIDINSENKSKEIESCLLNNNLLLEFQKNLIDKNAPYNVVFDIRRKDNNEIRTLHSLAELTYDDDGRPNKIMGVILDITEEQEQLKTLRKTEAEIKAVFDHENYNIWSINTAYEISYVNNKFANEFEYYFGTRLKRGVNVYEALPLAIKDVWRKRYDRVLSHEAFVFEEQVPYGEGFIFVEVSASPILVDEHVIGASFFGLDITERKMHELKLLQAKEQLQQLLQLSSTFIKKSDEKIDYQQITDIIKGIAGAKYAVLNSYSDNGKKCVTKAICTKSNWLDKVEKIFNFKILNTEWNVDGNLRSILQKRMTNKFEKLSDLAENTIYKFSLNQIQNSFNVGNIYSISIFSNEELIGNLYLFFDQSKDIQNIELCELFANHIGEFLGRKISESKLTQKMDEMERFHRLTVGRELTMIELKKEVNELLRQLGKEDKYKIVGQ